jgi:hypothetical protein
MMPWLPAIQIDIPRVAFRPVPIGACSLIQSLVLVLVYPLHCVRRDLTESLLSSLLQLSHSLKFFTFEFRFQVLE